MISRSLKQISACVSQVFGFQFFFYLLHLYYTFLLTLDAIFVVLTETSFYMQVSSQQSFCKRFCVTRYTPTHQQKCNLYTAKSMLPKKLRCSKPSVHIWAATYHYCLNIPWISCTFSKTDGVKHSLQLNC